MKNKIIIFVILMLVMTGCRHANIDDTDTESHTTDGTLYSDETQPETTSQLDVLLSEDEFEYNQFLDYVDPYIINENVFIDYDNEDAQVNLYHVENGELIVDKSIIPECISKAENKRMSYFYVYPDKNCIQFIEENSERVMYIQNYNYATNDFSKVYKLEFNESSAIICSADYSELYISDFNKSCIYKINMLDLSQTVFCDMNLNEDIEKNVYVKHMTLYDNRFAFWGQKDGRSAYGFADTTGQVSVAGYLDGGGGTVSVSSQVLIVSPFLDTYLQDKDRMHSYILCPEDMSVNTINLNREDEQGSEYVFTNDGKYAVQKIESTSYFIPDGEEGYFMLDGEESYLYFYNVETGECDYSYTIDNDKEILYIDSIIDNNTRTFLYDLLDISTDNRKHVEYKIFHY